MYLKFKGHNVLYMIFILVMNNYLEGVCVHEG